MDNIEVGIIMGSDSDLPVMQKAADVLTDFGVGYFMTVASAHRTPERVTALARRAEQEDWKVWIAGAGMAAHLAGFLAAHTALPVIGVPMDSSSLRGLDALLSTVQMPGGETIFDTSPQREWSAPPRPRFLIGPRLVVRFEC